MAMTNEEITNEFETLFGDEAEEEETSEEEPTDEPEETEKEDESEEEESKEEETEEESKEEPDEKSEDKKQAKQNYAFAQQRQQIKAQEKFIKNLGRLIGMENAKPEDIQNRIQEVLLEKQSKEQNVPVELLQRLERAEAIVQENQEIKLQNAVQNSFTELVEKHNLGPDEVNEFTQYLIENGKNPMEHPEVDIDAEYLKLHYNDMIQNAVQAALNKEKERQDKVKGKASSPAPDGKGEPDDSKINTVEDLDRMFGSMNL